MAAIQVRGTEFAYVEQGQGEPLVFVHGSLGDYRNWGLQMEAFSKRYRTFAYSRRYHYPNPWAGDGLDYSVLLHAKDLAAFIRELDLGRVHLVGSSYGAYTSLLLAVRHPELVRTLVLGEPPILPWLEQSPAGQALLATFQREAWEPARQAFEAGDLEQGVRTFIDGVIGRGAFDRLPPPARASMLDNAQEMKVETVAPGYFSAVTCAEVGGIQVPTLLLTGELSPKMFHVISDELEHCLTHAERALIPQASHGMHTQNPQAFNEIVLAFLARHAD